MKRCLIIINPSSGKHIIQNKLDRIIGQLTLQNIVEHFEIFYTEKKDDAYYKAKDCDENQYDFIMSVGGDGTLNEVISGMVDSHKKIPLCILAAGTVNDFANYLNIPSSVNGIVEMIKNFNVISSDVGKINDQYFINVAAAGMFSDISFVVSKEEKKKYDEKKLCRTMGVGMSIIAILVLIKGMTQLPQQLSTNLHLNVTVDNESFEEDAYMFAITNTNRVGGFDGIIPFADINDGKLDLVIVKRCSITDLIALIKDYRFGKHDKSPFIHYIQGQHIHITCDQDLTMDIDGEEGTHLPIDVHNLQKSIQLLVPLK